MGYQWIIRRVSMTLLLSHVVKIKVKFCLLILIYLLITWQQRLSVISMENACFSRLSKTSDCVSFVSEMRLKKELRLRGHYVLSG